MAVTDRRIGAHHVEVFFSVIVPDVHALGTSQYDWQGLVVLGTVLCLEIDAAIVIAAILQQ